MPIFPANIYSVTFQFTRNQSISLKKLEKWFTKIHSVSDGLSPIAKVIDLRLDEDHNNVLYVTYSIGDIVSTDFAKIEDFFTNLLDEYEEYIS